MFPSISLRWPVFRSWALIGYLSFLSIGCHQVTRARYVSVRMLSPSVAVRCEWTGLVHVILWRWTEPSRTYKTRSSCCSSRSRRGTPRGPAARAEGGSDTVDSVRDSFQHVFSSSASSLVRNLIYFLCGGGTGVCTGFLSLHCSQAQKFIDKPAHAHL